MTDEAEEVWDVPTPAVVSVAAPPTNVPDSVAQSDKVESWEARDLVDEVFEYDKRFGQTGSPTRVLAVRDVTPERTPFPADSGEAATAQGNELLAARTATPTSWG